MLAEETKRVLGIPGVSVSWNRGTTDPRLFPRFFSFFGFMVGGRSEGLVMWEEREVPGDLDHPGWYPEREQIWGPGSKGQFCK